MSDGIQQNPPPPGDVCASCGLRVPVSQVACEECGCIRGDASGTHFLAPRLRRLTAYLIDSLLIGIVGLVFLFAVAGASIETVVNDQGEEVAELQTDPEDSLIASIGALAVALLIWPRVARRGQSPGQRLMGLIVHDTAGGIASVPKIMARDLWSVALGVVVELIAFVAGSDSAAVSNFSLIVLVAVLADGVWVFVNRDRRALHDLIVGTVVVERRARVLGVVGRQHL